MVGLPKVNARSFVRDRIVSKIIDVSIFDRRGIKDNVALEVTSSGKNTTHRRPGRRHLPLPPCPCFCSCQASSFSPRLFSFLRTYVHFFSSVTRSIRLNVLVDRRNSQRDPATYLLICASSPLPWSFLPRVLPPLQITTYIYSLYGGTHEEDESELGRTKKDRPIVRRCVK